MPSISVQSVLSVLTLSMVLSLGCSKAPQAENSQAQDQIATNSIIGGTEVSSRDYFSKVIVALYDKKEGALCTASILSDSVAVTAAHCVTGQPQDLVVIFSTDIDQASQATIRQVVDTAVPAGRNLKKRGGKGNDDIALVKFEGGLVRGYQAAKVLSNATALKTGGTVTLAGYGLSDGVSKAGSGVLRQVDVEIINPNFNNAEVLLDQSKGRGACHGDSGGPAYVTDARGNFLLWGVTSRGYNDPTDTCGASSVYTNILGYSDWIDQTTQTWASN